MRGLLLAIGCLACWLPMGAQQGFLPLSRTLEAPYAEAMHRYGTARHTAIRPFLRRDLEGLQLRDTSRLASLLPALDRWAGGARLRGGPLAEAELGASLGESDVLKHRAGAGAWLDWDLHEKLAFHVDGMVWNERFPDYLDTLVRATQVTPGEGYAFGDGPSWTHYDWNAYLNWHPSKYFDLTLGRGRHHFGEGYRSLFLSDNAYSYPYFKITTTFWHIRYVNLFTIMNDIRGAGGVPGDFGRKFASFHYLSWNASKRFNFAVFEGIVWQDNDPDYPRGFDINYLSPVVLYRPVEFAQGSPDNALLGFGVNVKVAKRNTLYINLMLDEFLYREVRGGNGWFGNKQAIQAGVVAYEAFQVPELTLRAEVNYVRPFMYTHSDTRQNYSHHGQPLAHPYGSNFVELLGVGDWRKGRWQVHERFSYAVMGQDTGAYSWGNNIFLPESARPPRDAEGRLQNYGFYHGDVMPKTILANELRAGYVVDPHGALLLEVGWQFRMAMPEGGEDLMTNYLRVGLSCRFRDRHPDQEVRYVLP